MRHSAWLGRSLDRNREIRTGFDDWTQLFRRLQLNLNRRVLERKALEKRREAKKRKRMTAANANDARYRCPAFFGEKRLRAVLQFGRLRKQRLAFSGKRHAPRRPLKKPPLEQRFEIRNTLRHRRRIHTEAVRRRSEAPCRCYLKKNFQRIKPIYEAFPPKPMHAASACIYFHLVNYLLTLFLFMKF